MDKEVLKSLLLWNVIQLCTCITPTLQTDTSLSQPPITNETLIDVPSTRFTLTDLNLLENPPSNGWQCPHIYQIPDISCACDHNLPHTIRCRGNIKSPSELKDLISILEKDHLEISLLDLDLHHLNGITPNTFSGMSLLGLIISTAGLKTLSAESFTGIESTLAALGLPSNVLDSVPSSAINRLKKLQRLDLSSNNIEVLPAKAFPKLLMLHDLNLSENGLIQIKQDAFVNLPRLKTLTLSNNNLNAEQLHENSLGGLKMLNSLILSENNLKGDVTPDLISGPGYLTHLDLSHNQFTTIKRNALKRCSSLQTLILSNNNIEVIEDHAFYNLSELRRLEIAHNKIVGVSGYSFSHMPKLSYLNLADNALRTATADLIHQLPKLEVLDLAANDITLLQTDVFNATPNIRSLSLTDNPLHCDCNIVWLKTWWNLHISNKEDDIGPVCATPLHLDNAHLMELKSTDLKCTEDENYNDYNEYYHDDSNVTPPPISDTKISFLALSSEEREVTLEWHIDDKAFPYTCYAVLIYDVKQSVSNVSEHIDADCSSTTSENPNKIQVSISKNRLLEGNTYKYCLILKEKGKGDEEDLFAYGCSTPMLFIKTSNKNPISGPIVNSLTAGSVTGSLVIHTRIYHSSPPCTYFVVVVSGKNIAATRHFNCSDVRQEIPLKHGVEYVVCSSPDKQQDDYLNQSKIIDNLKEVLKNSENTTKTLTNVFSLCTEPIKLEEYYKSKWSSNPWLTLLFTIPGFVLIITLYILGRKVWKGGGIPWKWDKRAMKSAKYFLYTGENNTPCASLDPIPTEIPEDTTKV